MDCKNCELVDMLKSAQRDKNEYKSQHKADIDVIRHLMDENKILVDKIKELMSK